MRYFVDPTRRLVRTTDGDEVFPSPWQETTSQEFDAFRKETAKDYTPKKLRALRQKPLDVKSVSV